MTVVAAFPATGKSYVAGRDNRLRDSDSSSFSWGTPGVRNPNWPANYVRHIRHALSDGDVVLCSTHQDVRDALVAAEIDFVLVYPSEDQREVYVERIKERGSPVALVDLVANQWDDLIASCRTQEGCHHVVLGADEYLADVLPHAIASSRNLSPEENA